MMKVELEKCTGCGQCIKDCFPGVIKMMNGKANISTAGCMKCGHCIAVCPNDAVSTNEYNMEEVNSHNEKNFSIDSEQLLNFIKFRRTIRQFKNQDVEQEKISKIIEAGRFTQTGSNAQDVSYIVVRRGLEELKTLTYESLKKMGEAILARSNSEDETINRYARMWINMYHAYKENPKKNDKLFFNAPLVIIVTAQSQVNGVLASSNMELMTNALGLGTLFSGFFVRASQNDTRIMDYLSIEEGKQIATCMVIGYPDVKYFRTVPRKEANICWK